MASQLYKQGWNVTVICLEKDMFYHPPSGVKLIYLKSKSAYSILSFKLFELFYFAFRLRNIVRKKDIKIVQSHLFRANYVNLLAKILGAGHKAQVVNTVAVGSKYKNKNLKSFFNLSLIKMLYPAADKVIFKSMSMAHDFKERFRVNMNHVIINNPCDIKMIERLSGKKDCNLSIAVDSNTIIAVGRFEKHKHYELLVTVFKRLLADFPLLNLLIIGDGPERPKIRELVNTLNITKQVRLPGRIENPFYFLARAGMYVSCSESEGFPNALLEAMACGLPVISSDCLSGPREILSPDSNQLERLESGYEKAKYGILFAVNHKDALNKAIAELMTDKALYGRYREKSKQRVNDYKLDRVIERYKSILKST
ncbi:MAG: glycosyltransferase [Spirochaetales bacterium]|nr:glycosyltransferase [Spirochaetales bacterium]